MLDYDPYSDTILDDPYPVYKKLRDESPVHYIEEYNCWFLSRFDVAWDTASDSTHFHTKAGTTPGHLLVQDTPVPLSFNAYDPPEHTPLRSQVKPRFVPVAARGIRPAIETLVSEILDEMIEAGEGDLVNDFGARVAVTGACIAGGMPLEICDQAVDWVNGIMHRRDGRRGSTEVGAQAGKDMFFWCLDLTKEMRKNPEKASGVLHTLLTTKVGDEKLNDFAVASTLSLIMIGGSDTFPKALGSTIHRLWQHPDQRKEVVEDPSLARGAFLEALRLDTPTQMLGRICVEQTEVEGNRIDEGQGVMFLWASANRDEREFENPDAYDIHRRPPRMLAFGQGAHMCIGHHIAKMEADVALRALLSRAPDYEIDESRARRNRTEFVQGWLNLPTRLG
ncbi:MAG: cytochrome P450 [Myxococcota bacterium]|nr:cytochrome P450 [Myxococcota bacterium]